MAYLLILKGPNDGQWLPLEEPRISLGRHADCNIRLKLKDPEREKSISQKHALIVREGEHYYLEDGDGQGKRSKNHTYHNAVPVPFPKRVLLRPNDVITICDFVFLFSDGPQPETEADTPSAVDASIRHGSSSSFAQTTEKLKILLEIGTQLSSTLEIDTLLPRIVDNLLKHFKHADRAFLIDFDAVSKTLVPRILKTRVDEKEARGEFSVSIIRQCLREVQGLLSNDPKGQFPDSASVAGLGLETVMCAPLWNQDGKAFGVLLLDSKNATRKFTEDDLSFLMGVASQASIALVNARSHRDALMRERYERDLAVAGQVARSFLPHALPRLKGYEFFATTEPALEVGGDYYDFVPLAEGKLAILVGDVSGKGVAAALVMARFSAEARACLRHAPDLASAFRQLNDAMLPVNLTDRFVTLVGLVLDPARGTLMIANAGHPTPIIRRASGILEKAIARADIGVPMGVMEGYAYVQCDMTLAPGDVVVLVSDGVTEAMDKKRRQFGMDGLGDVLHQGAPAPIDLAERVLDAVKKHAAGCPQHDDITLVVVGRSS